jgi:branched-chain amino acid aminotransferase/4-amino-4-deoxychorismate lyase
MLNSQGLLAGCAAANLFWIRGDRLFTPALQCGVLDGVMRAQVLASAGSYGLDPVECAEGPQALKMAEAAFVTNSLIGVRPVSSLGNRAFGADERLRLLVAGLARFC